MNKILNLKKGDVLLKAKGGKRRKSIRARIK